MLPFSSSNSLALPTLQVVRAACVYTEHVAVLALLSNHLVPVLPLPQSQEEK